MSNRNNIYERLGHLDGKLDQVLSNQEVEQGRAERIERRVRSLEHSRARVLGVLAFITTGPALVWGAVKAIWGKA